jgi:hypothetical protein
MLSWASSILTKLGMEWAISAKACESFEVCYLGPLVLLVGPLSWPKCPYKHSYLRKWRKQILSSKRRNYVKT